MQYSFGYLLYFHFWILRALTFADMIIHYSSPVMKMNTLDYSTIITVEVRRDRELRHERAVQETSVRTVCRV